MLYRCQSGTFYVLFTIGDRAFQCVDKTSPLIMVIRRWISSSTLTLCVGLPSDTPFIRHSPPVMPYGFVRIIFKTKFVIYTPPPPLQILYLRFRTPGTVQCEIHPTHLINTQCKQCLCTHGPSLSINIHTISNPRI